ncbi:beta-1,6-N-acetylglucosaminyltransferase [Histidinibacterium lentulum]|uniref:Peptide O-xylosyltransferase n=1 Tax=Histidinibacterium lentulum TaxID=2480588 RepID=A0A3N2R6L9_9RHOB|nr:beta-1,6-N-acetylglucosaminyltransferase [Histidinibacterium lentulum]ROU03057.1 glycosyl transferase [Histidinibacterium lentulum]
MSGPVGIVILIHTAFDRAEQVIRHWVAGGCPVVVHVDAKVRPQTYDRFVHGLSDLTGSVLFCKRHRCEWGTWGIVAASQAGAEMMLERFPGVQHVYLASGSCLPLRPVRELVDYLAERPGVDFIESATTADVPWVAGGLAEERFVLRFPFSWKRQRFLFDRWVEIQRRFGLHREIPEGLTPHMGSQWWCLTRETMTRILKDPARARYDAYFRLVWIPDESYFQTLARLYARNIESRSLTLSKFDFQGKPHIFYDDHLQPLRRSDCFVARKIWPHADRLYEAFLDPSEQAMKGAEPNPGKIDRIFAKAVERRTRGRPGLYMQSRLPNEGWENGFTSAPYSVFEGFSDLFEDFEPWLARTTGARVHGHLFATHGVEFEGRQDSFAGALSASAAIRDYNSRRFLTSLIWMTRGERQCFQFGPFDQQIITWDLAKDPNAQISVISGAWAVPLFLSGGDFAELRTEAARLQKIESEHLKALRSPYAKARIRIWTMAEFIESPLEALQTVIEEFPGSTPRRVTETPRMVDLTGFGQFLQNLKNEGMHPYLMGDFHAGGAPRRDEPPRRKRYLVR